MPNSDFLKKCVLWIKKSIPNDGAKNSLIGAKMKRRSDLQRVRGSTKAFQDQL
jgi:hypothetical protein